MNQINQIEKAASSIAKTLSDVEKIKTYLQTMNLASNLSQQEVTQFIEIAQSFGLNPFKREIYASKYGNNFSVIVGFETYIKRAERSGLLSGWNVTTAGSIAENNLKAIITIHRKDFQFPFVHEVEFSEYLQRTREGKPTKFWSEKPITMIKKVAMAQGFRLCFSDELGGMPYTAEELPTQEQHVQAVVIPAKPAVDHSFIETTLVEAMQEVETTSSVEALSSVWRRFENLHGVAVFKNAVKDRKTFLQQEQKKRDILRAIDEATDETSLIDLLADETDHDILDAAMHKIESLSKI